MLNEKGIRELAYMVEIDSIEPIIGSDNCEAAVVGGWRVMVKKDTFKPKDLAIYFEIDSAVDAGKPEFSFLSSKHGKIKTQKYRFGGKGNFLSQGLLMHPVDLGWKVLENKEVLNPNTKEKYRAGSFLTEVLGVTYAESADNTRKASSADKYKKMAQRHQKLFSKKPIRWLMRKEWGKKMLFVFFGKQRDKKNAWPTWVVKTDEERCQNLSYLFPGDETEWIATEKIDGTSTTFTMKKNKRKLEFYVCSRNVVFDKPDKKCFYDSNVYLEMAEKYDIENVLKSILTKELCLSGYFLNEGIEFVTIQGETYGEGIQKRTYGIKGHDFKAFNLIFGFSDGRVIRFSPIEMTEILSLFDIPCVPIVDENFKIPATCDELLEIAAGPSALDGLAREGLVFRTFDGARSFKAVDNGFLMKYHG